MIAGAGWCTTAGHKLMCTVTGHVQRVHAVDTAAAGCGIELVAHTVGLYSQLDGRLLSIINTVSDIQSYFIPGSAESVSFLG